MQKLLYLPNEKITDLWAKEELLNIKRILNKKHLIYLENESFEVESGVFEDQIQIRVSLIKNDRSIYYPIECIFMKEHTEESKDVNIAFKMLEYLDIYWAHYFSEERNIFVPLDWSKHEFEGISFYIRGFVRNLNLETSANDFLSKHGHGEYDIHSISAET